MRVPVVVPALVGVVLGGWFLFDGTNVLRKGKYFGPEEPGPWAQVVSAAGVDPFRMGVPFVILGVFWLAVVAGLLAGARWAVPAGMVAAAATVWYLPLGTVLSIVFVVLLFLRR